MSLSIIDRNKALSQESKQLLKRRLSFALSRFESKIRRTTAVIEDINGPRGGVDKVCRITVQLDRARDVVVKNQDAELPRCIAHAAERIGRAVARAVERSQDSYRKRPLDSGTI